MRPRLTGLVVALALVAGRAGAEAQDPVAAEQLFLAARAAMDQGDYETACQRFAESQRLDPAAGTLINLAECLDRRGLVASSWQRWKEALDSLRPDDDRRAAVAQRLSAMEARLSRLVLRLASGAPEGSTVERDGLVLGAASLGLAVPVDPGAHRVVARAPGHAPREYTLTLAEAKTEILEVTPGDRELPAPAALPTATTPPIAGDAGSKIRAPTPANPTRTWGYVVTGVGALSLGTGVTFGILAAGKKQTMDDECRAAGRALDCSSAGVDAAHSGKTFATIANIGVAVGVVGAGVGLALILSSGESGTTEVSAVPAPGGGTLHAGRTF